VTTVTRRDDEYRLGSCAARYVVMLKHIPSPKRLKFHNQKHQNCDLLERRNRRLEPNCSSFSTEKVLTSWCPSADAESTDISADPHSTRKLFASVRSRCSPTVRSSCDSLLKACRLGVTPTPRCRRACRSRREISNGVNRTDLLIVDRSVSSFQ
jgi:hypothetical protein